MEFAFTDDQQQIADAATSFLQDVSPMTKVRLAMAQDDFNAKTWDAICNQMGWHLTLVPENQGGLGLGYVELCILLEKMGRHLVCAPFYSTLVLGVNALRVLGREQQQAKLFAQLVEDGSTFSLAYANQERAWGLEAIGAEYKIQTNGDALLNGDYSYVVDGHVADYLIVAARQAGRRGDLGLFIVKGDASGISRRRMPTMDQTRKLAEVQCQDVRILAADVMHDEGQADQTGKAIEEILALASIGLAAEQLGVADQTLAMTLDYIKERKQFGRAIGSFQAMKHKAADMLVRAEAARSAVYYAACIADEYFGNRPLGAELLEAASIAKSYCCDAAFFNAGSALQMHGGVGFTWEYDVHLFFKRAKAAQVALGDDAWHKARLAEMVLGDPI